MSLKTRRNKGGGEKEDILLLENDISSFNIQQILLRLILFEMKRYFTEKNNESIKEIYDKDNEDDSFDKIHVYLNREYKFIDYSTLTDKLTVIYNLIDGDNKKEKLLFQIYIFLKLYDEKNSGMLNIPKYYIDPIEKYNGETYENLKQLIQELLKEKKSLLKTNSGGSFKRQRTIKVIRKY